MPGPAWPPALIIREPRCASAGPLASDARPIAAAIPAVTRFMASSYLRPATPRILPLAGGRAPDIPSVARLVSWGAYPNKVGKPSAFKVWRRGCLDDVLHETGSRSNGTACFLPALQSGFIVVHPKQNP
jgi:hypothetical protein